VHSIHPQHTKVVQIFLLNCASLCGSLANNMEHMFMSALARAFCSAEKLQAVYHSACAMAVTASPDTLSAPYTLQDLSCRTCENVDIATVVTVDPALRSVAIDHDSSD
jgi:hypothetical protein